MLSWVGASYMEYVLGLHGNVDAPTGTGTFEVSSQLKSVVKHRTVGVG